MKEKLSKDEIIAKVLDTFSFKDKVKINETWVIKFEDRIIRMPSGKSSWKAENHASSAFTNSICYLFSKYREGISASEVTKLLREEGIIKIEKL